MIQAKLTLLIGILLLAVLTGCTPKQKITDEVNKNCQPNDMLINVNDASMEVSWKNDCESLISGYNVYISEESLKKTANDTDLPKPHNLVTFAGDTEPEDGIEHYQAEYLENGKKYYVSVRVVYPDQTLSNPTTEELVVCGPRGEMELSIRYQSDQDGFSFNKNEYVKANDSDNDLYFFSKDGKDYLNSPSKLDAFIKKNSLSVTGLKGDFKDVRAKLNSVSSEYSEKVGIKKGDWILITRTDKKSAIVNVLDITGSGKDRKIKLFYAFSPIAGELIF